MLSVPERQREDIFEEVDATAKKNAMAHDVTTTDVLEREQWVMSPVLVRRHDKHRPSAAYP
jgi:hypothetical protein